MNSFITYCEAQAGHRNNQLVRFCCTGDLWESVLSFGVCGWEASIEVVHQSPFEIAGPIHSLKEVVRLVYITAKLSE